MNFNLIKYVFFVIVTSSCSHYSSNIEKRELCVTEGTYKKKSNNYEKVTGVILGYIKILKVYSLTYSNNNITGFVRQMVALKNEDVYLFEKHDHTGIPLINCFIFQVHKKKHRYSDPQLVSKTDLIGRFMLSGVTKSDLLIFTTSNSLLNYLYDGLEIKECFRREILK